MDGGGYSDLHPGMIRFVRGGWIVAATLKQLRKQLGKKKVPVEKPKNYEFAKKILQLFALIR
jgi:hypothetical protein